MLSFAIVVPTRNRPADIRKLLDNLIIQSVYADQLVIVDSSDVGQEDVIDEYRDLSVEYYRYEGEPSAAAQRNAGLDFLRDDIDLVCFVDDDIFFQPDAIKVMIDFWRSADSSVCGAAFNLSEPDVSSRGVFKYSRLADWLGLYRRQPGAVAKSGWHSRLGQVPVDTDVEWLISGASVWRREVFREHRFDAFFQGYSYLEDLDFSYGVSRTCRLVVVAGARFEHHHHHRDLDANWYKRFGRMEVLNRLYIVRKYQLSVWRCYLGLGIRFFQTLLQAIKPGNRVLLSRAQGNLAGFWDSIKGSA